MQKESFHSPPRNPASSPPATKDPRNHDSRRRAALCDGHRLGRHGLTTRVSPATTSGRLGELQVQTRFLRLRKPAVLGDHIEGWRVCWLGGWDKGKVFFVVIVERVVGRGVPKVSYSSSLQITRTIVAKPF